jgi:hypothetical protein
MTFEHRSNVEVWGLISSEQGSKSERLEGSTKDRRVNKLIAKSRAEYVIRNNARRACANLTRELHRRGSSSEDDSHISDEAKWISKR